VCAAIGRGQMEVLADRVAQRRKNHAFYKSTFEGIDAISFLEEPEGYFSNRWLTTVLVDGKVSREQIRLALDEDNIESRPLWKPMHLQPVFADAPAYTNGVSEGLFDKGLCLPSGSILSKEDLEQVAAKVKALL